jgi:glycosyltransferase involved in cell wall biosynthesis
MSQNKPLLSFILLSYNQEKFIREAVEAAFAQTYSPLEIILSDDCSGDETFKIMSDLASNYRGPHQIILNKNETNLGIGRHVKKCFKMAKGEWIVGAAGDDISLPSRCEILWNAVNENSAGIYAVGSDCETIDESGNPHEDPLGLKNHHQKIKNITTKFHGVDDCLKLFGDTSLHLPGCAAMWHRDVFNGWPKFVEGLTYEDLTLTARAIMLGRVHVISDKLVKYRTSANAMTNRTHVNILKNVHVRRQHELRRYKSAEQMASSLSQILIDLDSYDMNMRSTQKSIFVEHHDSISKLKKKMDNQSKLMHWNQSNLIARIWLWLTDSRCPHGRLKMKCIKHLMPAQKIGIMQITLEKIIKLIKNN